jgi:glucose/arabinose dehydrogenase
MIRILPVTATFVLLASLFGAAQAEDVLKGKAAVGGWQQDKPGLRRLLTPADLPPVGKSVQNFSQTAPMPAGAKPLLPPGFSAELVASGIQSARTVRFAPNGDLFVADSKQNTVRVLRIPAGSAKPERNEVFASGLSQPYGIAFYPLGPNPKWVYIANDDGVVRFAYKNGDLTASGKSEEIVRRIPWTHHWTRDIVFAPDGKQMLLAVGSGSNVALDMFPMPFVKGGLEEWARTKPLGATWDTEERRAAVLSFDPDGKNEKIFATGLRNCSGLAIQPATGQPWCVVNERDGIGDNTPFEYATR